MNESIRQSYTAEYMLPFSVTEEDMRPVMLQWLSQGDYMPIDIYDIAHIISVRGVFLPFYCFQGDYGASFSCSIGYNREEVYTEYVKRRVNNRDISEPVTRRRTVTDWHPYSGSVSDSCCIIDIGSQCFLRLDQANTKEYTPSERKVADEHQYTRIRELSNFCAVSFSQDNDIQPFSELYTRGFEVEPFELTQEQVFNSTARREVIGLINKQITREAPGDRIRDTHIIDWSFEHDTFSLYLPYWFVKYEYCGKVYLCVISGTDSNKVCGTKPFDHKKRETIKQNNRIPLICLGITSGFVLLWLLIVISGGVMDGSMCSGILMVMIIVSTAAWFNAHAKNNRLIGYDREHLAHALELALQNPSIFFSSYSNLSDSIAFTDEESFF